MYELQGKPYILKKKQVITQWFLLEPLLELDTQKLIVCAQFIFVEAVKYFQFLKTQNSKICISLHCFVAIKRNRKAQSLQLCFKPTHSHANKSQPHLDARNYMLYGIANKIVNPVQLSCHKNL